MLNEQETLQVLAMTLAEYAAARGTHVQAVRREYRDIMRRGTELTLAEPTRMTRDGNDGTTKFCLPSGEMGGKTLESETVIIPMVSYRGSNWHTLCVSSQVGCRMGCTFCETGRMGLLRNLTAGEIVRQRAVARRLREQMPATAADAKTERDHARDAARRDKHRAGMNAAHSYFADGIQNIVFMGMGEPLDNFDNVVQAIRVLTEPAGMNFPHGQITVSTVGRIDGLRKLGALSWPNLRIAISLNAANDRLRDELMPVNKGMPLAELKRALLEYPMHPRGRFLIEYVLIKGVNDSPADAAAVIDFVRGLRCIVNVIPYNPQRFASFETPDDETVLAFMAALKAEKVFVKRRITHGRELMGACGQLGNPEVRRRELVQLR